jgi:hypothetical protein
MSFLLPAAPIIAEATAATAATTAATTAFGSTAFWAGTAAAAPMAASTFVPSLLVSSTPSFFGSISSAFNTIKPFMDVISPATQILGGINSLQAGQTQASMYKLQQLQLQTKVQNDRLNYERQGNDVLRRLLQSNASAVARGYAGGVKGFEGSSALLMNVNEKYAGQDMETIQQNISTSAVYGKIQDSMLTTASDTAVKGSYADFFTSMGKAAYLYSNLKTV